VFAAGAEAQLTGRLAVCLVGADIIDLLGGPGYAAPTMPPALAAFLAALRTLLWPRVALQAEVLAFATSSSCSNGDGYALRRRASALAT
jgi:hypothetical protein